MKSDTPSQPPSKPRKEKLTKKTIAFIHTLIEMGLSQKFIEHVSSPCNLLEMAIINAVMRRLKGTHYEHRTPSLHFSWPLALGWMLDGAKKGFVRKPSYMTGGAGLPWAELVTQEQPACAAASCSLIRWVSENSMSFPRAMQEASGFKILLEHLQNGWPPREGQDHCLSLQHAIEVIDDLYCGTGRYALHRTGMIPQSQLTTDQLLIIPIRFTAFIRRARRATPDKAYDPKIMSGLLSVRATTNRHFEENSPNNVSWQFTEGFDQVVPAQAIICLNNLLWESPQQEQ